MTRRTVVLLALLALCVLAFGAPALAQGPPALGDPFAPVVDPNAATGTDTTTETSGGTLEEPVTPPIQGSEGLANTGTDLTPWLVVAYGLLGLGAGALAWSKLNTPTPTRR